MRFPAEASRDVEVRYMAASCMGGFAWVTVDFEPLEGEALGMEFVNPLSPDELWPDCASALRQGILRRLAGVSRAGRSDDEPHMPGDEELRAGYPVLGDGDRGLIALRVVVRASRVHEVDTTASAHLRAGWRAADKGLFAAAATDDPRDRAGGAPRGTPGSAGARDVHSRG
ncbi:hypothetical protein OHS70_26310 [Streptomyces sp. NBC_00390]|uniref:hypothetical protein n=1 Tax=Streptomyces sp. NBC_00390 TaxID=2975736 RepID=UPI002E1F1478